MEMAQRQASGSTLVLAPLRKRLLATVINVGAVVGALVAAILIVAAPFFVLGEYDEEALEHVSGRIDAWRKKRSGRPKRAGPGVGIGLVLAIERRNRRGLGQQLMRIRRADAAGGGPIMPSSAAIHYLVSELIAAAVPDESNSAAEQRKERFRELAPELATLLKERSGEPATAVRESLTLVARNKANPFAPAIRSAGFQLAVHLLAIALSPKRQSLPDLAAGIVSRSDQ